VLIIFKGFFNSGSGNCIIAIGEISTSSRGSRNEFIAFLDVISSSTSNIFINLFPFFLIVVYFKVFFITCGALGYVIVS